MSSSLPLDRIRADVRAMHAYAVQNAAGLIKLDAMENPYRLSLALRLELGQRLGEVPINRYPGERLADLRRALAAAAAPPPGWSLMLGNGSDELIALLSLACSAPGAAVLVPEPSFVMYAISARLHGLACHGVPLRADFSLDESAMLHVIERHRPAIVCLAYPNNPTGTLWDEATLRHLIDAQAAAGGMVLIDEAYQPFARHSWMDCVRAAPERHRHVLLMRTLSKWGLAGARIGYLMGQAELIEQIDKVRPPYNVSLLDAECALFALEHAQVFAEQAAAICQERARLQRALAELPGIEPLPSEGNMLLVRLHAADPDASSRLFDGMKARGVLIKNVSKMHPLLANCVRLTVGTSDENTQMLAALRAAL